jgi:hypothetical protein
MIVGANTSWGLRYRKKQCECGVRERKYSLRVEIQCESGIQCECGVREREIQGECGIQRECGVRERTYSVSVACGSGDTV